MVCTLATAAALSGFGIVGSAFAESVDLSNPAVFSGTINGAIYAVDTTHPAGTGVFGRDAGGVFLTIQMHGTEQGYNSSAMPMDTKRPHWNHELLLNDLNIVDIGGSTYVPFLLDINEQANKNSFLSLDDLKIFTGPSAGVSHNSIEAMLADPTLTLRYSLDDFLHDTSSFVLLDYNRSGSGSGRADMAAFIPLDSFTGASLTDYVYLYAKFGGDVAGASSDAGFEEWTLGAGAPIPEPSSALLTGLAFMIGILQTRRRRR